MVEQMDTSGRVGCIEPNVQISLWAHDTVLLDGILCNQCMDVYWWIADALKACVCKKLFASLISR